MHNELEYFDYDQPLSILIGENGSGKSQMLARIAEAYISKSYSVIAIANCPFDKFRDHGKRYYFMGGRYGRDFISIALATVVDSIKEPSIARYNIGQVLSYLGFDPFLGVCQEKNSRQVSWYSLEASHSIIAVDGVDADRWNLNLNKGDLQNWPAVFLRKNKVEFPLEYASSGEIQMFTMLAFIASNITEKTAIIIDEPENSLHPRWQRDYIRRLFDLFYSFTPLVVIATHSPVLVTSAPNINVGHHLYTVRRGQIVSVHGQTGGMEQVMWDVFKILTPKSNFLSRYIADLLHQLEEKQISVHDFNLAFRELRDAAEHDDKQSALIHNAWRLGHG